MSQNPNTPLLSYATKYCINNLDNPLLTMLSFYAIIYVRGPPLGDRRLYSICLAALPPAGHSWENRDALGNSILKPRFIVLTSLPGIRPQPTTSHLYYQYPLSALLSTTATGIGTTPQRTIRARTATSGPVRLVARLMPTTWTTILAASTLRIITIRATALVFAVSPASA